MYGYEEGEGGWRSKGVEGEGESIIFTTRLLFNSWATQWDLGMILALVSISHSLQSTDYFLFSKKKKKIYFLFTQVCSFAKMRIVYSFSL